ncbi:MAG TPA: sulfite exporter TauE/SafE family protein [Roseiarcus sp.]
MILAALFVASIWAGAQNALAGGGSFITLPALILTGMDARAANITSTVALFPAQLITGYTGRDSAAGVPELSFKALAAISLVGGAVGGIILLATPPSFFAVLVPWLVLFATATFAWGSFIRKQPAAGEIEIALPRWGAAFGQFLIAVYGGYFGGGIGFLMMAALSMAGQGVRNAAATKNVLAGIINASAVAIFVFSPDVHWLQVLITAAGASLGGWSGALALQRVNEKALRFGVVAVGILLTIGLFLHAP